MIHSPLQDRAFHRTQRQVAVSHHPEMVGLHRVQVEQHPNGWRLRVKFVPPAPSIPQKQAVPANLSPTNWKLVTAAGEPAPLLVQSTSLDSADPIASIVNIAPLPHTTAEQLLSQFQLQLIDVPTVDPYLASVSFSLTEQTPLDPKELQSIAPELKLEAEIDYLAKDYNSFRTAILDRLSLLVPQWQERHAADLGVALVEVLSYAADYLSYYQDAVITESYIGTARRRISVRRHARLLDYALSEGCNARVWVRIEVKSPEDSAVRLPAGTQLLTQQVQSEQLQVPLRISKQTYTESFRHPGQPVQVFETMEDAVLYPAHNLFRFYTAGTRDYRLQQGATSAQLDGHFPHLRAGDVLIFEQAVSTTTGVFDTSILQNRHPVRLRENPVLDRDPLFQHPTTTIHWYPEDALPFPLPIAGRSENGRYLQHISVARGNTVLADYGATITSEPLPAIPSQGSYNPCLRFKDLTQAVPYRADTARTQSAKHALQQIPKDALPAISLQENWLGAPHIAGHSHPGNRWLPLPDLLECSPFARCFVVETESDGSIYLRFGNGQCGQKPVRDRQFAATYRVGNGRAGNVGPNTILHVVTDDLRIVGACNPLPAQGGTHGESLEQARVSAPEAFRYAQKRCVTEADYSIAAEQYPSVMGAVAKREWTGSWSTIALYIDRHHDLPIDADFIGKMSAFLHPVRMAGIDIQILPPKFVPLAISLEIVVRANMVCNHVRQILKLAFSSVEFSNGELGFFHPDNFTFGQPLYLSQLVNRAMQVEGVERVQVNELRRYGQPSQGELAAGLLAVSDIEILQLDSRLRSPERGTIQFQLLGGL